MFRDPLTETVDVRAARQILIEVNDQGVDGIRIAMIADRLELSIATLYRRWGGRRLLLTHAWRRCIDSLESQVRECLFISTPDSRALRTLWHRIWYGMPPHPGAFLELHSARRRWYRGDIESNGVVVPSLTAWVEVGQRLGYVRSGNSRTIAALIWNAAMEAFAGEGRTPNDRIDWCFHAVKRMVLTPEAMAEDAGTEIDALEVTEEIERPFVLP